MQRIQLIHRVQHQRRLLNATLQKWVDGFAEICLILVCLYVAWLVIQAVWIWWKL